MALPTKINLKIYQGSTFIETFRWESTTKAYKTISNITKAAPMVVTSTSHGIPAGWRVKITNVLGMKEVNSSTDYKIITNTTANDLTFGGINSAGYTTYTSGGIIEFNEPMNLSGVTARMQIRQKITSTTVIDEFTTENSGIIVDNNSKTVTLTMTAAETEAYTFKSAVYSMELISGSIVTPFIYGNITLESEITR